ncbi:DMT family transporter [Fundidesulfovibrio butyratiphilus]
MDNSPVCHENHESCPSGASGGQGERPPRSARSGVAVGLACAAGGTGLWGLSFVVPVFLPGVSPWDVSLGRYLIFGVIGLIGMRGLAASGERLTREDWIMAVLLSVTGYYGCYTLMVYAVNLCGPALPTLVMGLTPITVAVTGALRGREGGLSRLVGPLASVGLGLLAVNLARHGQGLSGVNLGAGLACSVAALAMLTYYLVANLLFLKRHPRISPMAWANAVGFILLWMSLGALGLRLLLQSGWPWEGTPTPCWTYFAAVATLGVGASWVGGLLWNKANRMLPASLAGQCIVFWPVSGVILACLVERSLPSPVEAAGMTAVFAGVWWGVRVAASGDGRSSS